MITKCGKKAESDISVQSESQLDEECRWKGLRIYQRSEAVPANIGPCFIFWMRRPNWWWCFRCGTSGSPSWIAWQKSQTRVHQRRALSYPNDFFLLLTNDHQFIELSSCEEEEPASRRLRTKPSLNSGKKPATTTGTAASSPNTHLGSSKKTAKLLIPERVKHCEPSVLSSRNEEVTISATASNDSDVSTFSQAGWKTCFIPTLNHCLASASNPWDIGSGVDIIVVIQGIIDKVYPDSGYRVKFGDKIYLKVRRINQRRLLY